jgi:hypothetical protein
MLFDNQSERPCLYPPTSYKHHTCCYFTPCALWYMCYGQTVLKQVPCSGKVNPQHANIVNGSVQASFNGVCQHWQDKCCDSVQPSMGVWTLVRSCAQPILGLWKSRPLHALWQMTAVLLKAWHFIQSCCWCGMINKSICQKKCVCYI